jgi:hypothetical protein
VAGARDVVLLPHLQLGLSQLVLVFQGAGRVGVKRRIETPRVLIWAASVQGFQHVLTRRGYLISVQGAGGGSPFRPASGRLPVVSSGLD